MNYYYLFKSRAKNGYFARDVLDAFFDKMIKDFTPKHTENEMVQLVAMLSDLTEILIKKFPSQTEKDPTILVNLITSLIRIMDMKPLEMVAEKYTY